ncbi:MAG: hypothetical protein ACYTG2_16995 [Planctomycetota bacterium]|jgi:hypothetical protein
MNAGTTGAAWLAGLLLAVCPAATVSAATGAAAPGGASVVDQDYVVQAPTGPILLGERFELVVSGRFDGAVTLDLGELPPGLRADDARLEATADGVRLVQPLRAVREGALRLEQLAVVGDGTRQALPAVDLEVTLGLDPGRVPRVADPLPPVAVPSPPANVMPFALLAGLGLVLLGGFVVVAGRRVVPPPPLPRPPDLVATEALAGLRLHLPDDEGHVPPFVDAVSAVLRTYVEDRFGARAPESTTEEFLAELAGRHDALSGQSAALERFLRACDLVKFARHRPPPAGVVPLLDTAEAFVESTRA